MRLSGPGALATLKRFFKPSSSNISYSSHQLYHGHLIDENGSCVDEIMAVYMAAPRTYTRDDVVEIHCHGSQQIVKTVLDIFQKFGIRLAAPGEFTYRAFVNGRIDLSQAEAVAQLITSNSDVSRRLALSQSDGDLSRFIYRVSAQIKHLLVLSEAWIDFPEEDLPAEDIAMMTSTVTSILTELSDITKTFDIGRIQMEGASIILVGEPNSGKSSLLNKLLGDERAIVTDVPGTTRDLIEEGLFIDGLPVRLIDTAGLRTTSDLVEQEGIKRAENKMKQADLVLLLIDAHGLTGLDRKLLERFVDYPTFILLTKHDLGTVIIDVDALAFPAFEVSVKSGHGLEKLKKNIKEYLLKDSSYNDRSLVISERRHYEALLAASTNLANFKQLISISESLDLLSFELRESLFHLGQISGETTTEDILDDIFSGFCIGK